MKLNSPATVQVIKPNLKYTLPDKYMIVTITPDTETPIQLYVKKVLAKLNTTKKINLGRGFNNPIPNLFF